MVLASQPSSRGGINLQSAYLHAPAAFLASDYCSRTLMIGHVLDPSPHYSSAFLATVSRPDWQTLTCLLSSTCYSICILANFLKWNVGTDHTHQRIQLLPHPFLPSTERTIYACALARRMKNSPIQPLEMSCQGTRNIMPG